MQGRRLRGRGRVRRRVQLPLLELPRHDGLGFPAVGRDRTRAAEGHAGDGVAAPEGDAEAAHAVRCGQCWTLVYWTVHHHDRTWLRVPYGSLSDEPTLKPIAHMFV